MFPGMMNNDQFPTVKELWKDEKSKYRHWIILLGIGLFVITILSISSFVLNVINKNEIVENIKNVNKNIYKEKVLPNSTNIFYRNYIIFPTIIIVSLMIGSFLYVVTIYASYKSKNFARLSPWPTFAIGLGAVMALTSLVMTLIYSRRNTSFDNIAGIFKFVNQILYILIYILASSPVSKLRRKFLMSERMEIMQNDPHYKAAQEQFVNMMKGYPGAGYHGPNPGNFSNYPHHNPNQNNDASKSNNHEEKDTSNKTNSENSNHTYATSNDSSKKMSANENKLRLMSTIQLREVAKKLSISGFKTMRKDELIKAILRVTEN